jgi:hypothetical protein
LVSFQYGTSVSGVIRRAEGAVEVPSWARTWPVFGFRGAVCPTLEAGLHVAVRNRGDSKSIRGDSAAPRFTAATTNW